MPFPFLPGGILLAIAFLGAAFAAFGMAVRLLGGLPGAGHSIAAGVAAGLHDWNERPRSREQAAGSSVGEPPAGPDPDLPGVEDLTSGGVPTERVRR